MICVGIASHFLDNDTCLKDQAMLDRIELNSMKNIRAKFFQGKFTEWALERAVADIGISGGLSDTTKHEGGKSREIQGIHATKCSTSIIIIIITRSSLVASWLWRSAEWDNGHHIRSDQIRDEIKT